MYSLKLQDIADMCSAEKEKKKEWLFNWIWYTLFTSIIDVKLSND
jgi:hypothetical protein